MAGFVEGGLCAPILRNKLHTYEWKKLPDRKGAYCILLSSGKKNSVLVQFEDGFKIITSRYAIRKVFSYSR
jgi:hypothetical protein